MQFLEYNFLTSSTVEKAVDFLVYPEVTYHPASAFNVNYKNNTTNTPVFNVFSNK